eukprot:2098930-Pleurochrysis_carterae.AAC.1
MQRTIIPGPARRIVELCSRSNATSGIHMFVMHIPRKRLREHIASTSATLSSVPILRTSMSPCA